MNEPQAAAAPTPARSHADLESRPAPSSPGDEGEPFERLPLAALKAALLAGAIWWGVLSAAGLLTCVGLVIASGFAGTVTSLATGLWVAGSTALAALCLGWPRLRHRHTSYRADDRGLQIRRGVWWRSHLFVSRSRIQHTDVSQGPLQRRFGIASLTVHTAGTHNAATQLSGLSHQNALAARELLTAENGHGGLSDGI